MPKFISDDEMAKIEGAAPKKKHFISDAEMASMETPKKPPPGYAETIVRGGLQGGLAGWSDEGEGVLDTAIDVAKGNVPMEWDSVKERYGENTKKARSANALAEKTNPKLYKTSEFAGGVGSTLALPGVGAGAGLARVVGAGALQGAVSGAGYSEAEDLEGVGKDALISGAIGGGISAGAKIIPAAAKAAAKKTHLDDVYSYLKKKGSQVVEKGKSLLAGVPEEGLARYRVAPNAVNTARPHQEVGDEARQYVEDLLEKGVKGSQSAGAKLPDQKIAAGEIQDAIDSITGKSVLRKGKYREDAVKELEGWRENLGALTKSQKISLQDLNRYRQDLGMDIKFARKTGTMDLPENQAKKQLYGKVREILGKNSKDFDDEMKEVAKDFATKSKAQRVFGSERGSEAAVKRIGSGKSKRDEDLLTELAKRVGGKDLVQESKDYALQKIFDGSASGGFTGRRGIVGGSLGAAGEAYRQLASDNDEIDPLKIIMAAGSGSAIGAASDRYGPQAAKALMDSSREGLLKSSREGIEKVLDYAARRGPDALRAVQFWLLKNKNPQFREMLESQD